MKEMGSRLKFLLRRWEWEESRGAVDCEQQDEDDQFEEPSKKRVCKYCNRRFSGASALGGHIRIHRKKNNYPRRSPRAAASSPPCTENLNYSKEEAGSEVDLSQFLSGWKVHRKRGLRQARRSSEKSTEPEDN